MKDIAHKAKPRNKQWDLMRAIGIIFVVWGHNYQPPFLFYPAFYFQISLFFFISGYFFVPQPTAKEKVSFILKKTRNLLIPYLLLNIFFGLLTTLLKMIGIHLGNDLDLHSLFVLPFAGGDQFALYLAAWFLFNLYFVNSFAGLVYQKNTKVNTGIVILAIIFTLIFLHIGSLPNNSMWMKFLIRSVFGFCFFSLGYFFHVLEPRIQAFVIKPATLVILFLIVNAMSANFGEISYDILFGSVPNKLVFVPLITSLCIILLIYSLSFYGVKILKQNSIVFTIGENSFAIMVWHLFFFFLVNVALCFLGFVPFSALSDVYFRYNIERLWLFYQIPAILGPIFLIGEWRFWKGKVASSIR